MEYKDLITRVQRAPVDVPDTDAILDGMRRTLRRRRQQRMTVFGVVMLLLGSTMALPLLSSPAEPEPTLAERVSSKLDARPKDIPAPLAGYRHSLYNRQIFTLI